MFSCFVCGVFVQDDEAVLQKLEAMLEAGPDPELDALTKVSIWLKSSLAGRQRDRTSVKWDAQV